MQLVLTPELLLEAYTRGLFPMAHSAESPYVHWICPEMRGQLSISDLHVPKKLAKTMRQEPYEVRVDTDFRGVIEACAAAQEGRPETWINDSIVKAYCELHVRGHAHSVECWQDDVLVGGLYGLKIGGAFFGESMFSIARNASKIALVHLVARLYRGGFSILDTQFVNDHLKQFGVYEVPHEEYLKVLCSVLDVEVDFVQEGVCEDQLIEQYFARRMD